MFKAFNFFSRWFRVKRFFEAFFVVTHNNRLMRLYFNNTFNIVCVNRSSICLFWKHLNNNKNLTIIKTSIRERRNYSPKFNVIYVDLNIQDDRHFDFKFQISKIFSFMFITRIFIMLSKTVLFDNFNSKRRYWSIFFNAKLSTIQKDKFTFIIKRSNQS
jgi:hypothetical protein